MIVHKVYKGDDAHFGNLIIYYLQYMLRNTARYSPLYTQTISLYADCQPACAPD